MWIRQPLYAGDLWDVDKEDWEYEPVLVKDTETNNITVKFQQVPPEHLREKIFSLLFSSTAGLRMLGLLFWSSLCLMLNRFSW